MIRTRTFLKSLHVLLIMGMIKQEKCITGFKISTRPTLKMTRLGDRTSGISTPMFFFQYTSGEIYV